MKICLLSNYAERTDASSQKVAFYFYRALSKNNEVLYLNLQNIFQLKFWKELRAMRPDIIHYLPGPSLKSFIITRAFSWWSKESKTIMTALEPVYSAFSKQFIRFFRPNLVLTESIKTKGVLSDLGCKARLLPGGVDIEKFIPATQNEKRLFRQKYGLDESKFTVLTIAPIAARRGLELLQHISPKIGFQFIIVGSTATRPDTLLIEGLQNNGCIVWYTYFPDIEEVYKLSDCYIFPSPVRCPYRMELPLSVLEAMSCNLPVITTRYGALPELFSEDEGFYYCESEEDIGHLLDRVRDSVVVENREKVLPYSWQKLTDSLEIIYREVMDD